MKEPVFDEGPMRWFVWAVVSIVSLGAVTIAVQRWNTPEAAWAVPVALIGAVPWLLGALCVPVPRLVFALVVLGSTFVLVLYPVTTDFAPFQLVVLASIAAALEPPRWSIPVLIGAAAVVPLADVVGRFDGWLIWVLGITMAWLGGFSLHQQERAHEAREQRAAADERQRIARELHDVVAHSLAVTMLQLTGARLALRRDPAEAEIALRQAEESGRQSMADIRRAVGLLGHTGVSAAMPGAGDVPALVEEFRGAGLDADLSVTGDVSLVPPVTGLALYRIVEESMANAVKHAPGHAAHVAVEIDARSVCLSVVNRGVDGRSAREGGLGIPGMRERAALVGGSARSEPVDGEWRVSAELPFGAVQ